MRRFLKISKGSNERSIQARELRSEIAVFGSQAAAALGERLSKHLRPGEWMPDLTFFQELVGRELAALTEALDEADQELMDLRWQDHDQLGDRELATRELYEAMLAIRAGLVGACGRSAATEVLGFRGRLTRDTDHLLAVAKSVLRQLKGPGFVPPTARVAGFQLAPAEWAELLASRVQALDAALRVRPRGHGRARHLLSLQGPARRERDRFFRRTEAFLRALFGLAGVATKTRRARRGRGARTAAAGARPAVQKHPGPPVVA